VKVTVRGWLQREERHPEELMLIVEVDTVTVALVYFNGRAKLAERDYSDFVPMDGWETFT